MTKFYRVIKNNFLWREGAILASNGSGYRPVDNLDIWNNVPIKNTEYISDHIIEHKDNIEWFERIYKDTISGSLYKTADQIKDLYEKSFKK